ncbi:MAG TPA: hypothetical protein DCM55_02025 [Corynebacterium variabile]|nr:hypothetical protein [Corynebacterium variabile]
MAMSTPSTPHTPDSQNNARHPRHTPTDAPRSIAIIGAGLAGTGAALALARTAEDVAGLVASFSQKVTA